MKEIEISVEEINEVSIEVNELNNIEIEDTREVLTIGGRVTFSEYHEIFPNIFNDFVAKNITFIKNCQPFIKF